MKRWAVPGIPFALSLCLSLATVGSHPFWQDSGLYLTAIKDLGVLYPPGFALYEVLCRAWRDALLIRAARASLAIVETPSPGSESEGP